MQSDFGYLKTTSRFFSFPQGEKEMVLSHNPVLVQCRKEGDWEGLENTQQIRGNIVLLISDVNDHHVTTHARVRLCFFTDTEGQIIQSVRDVPCCINIKKFQTEP